MHQNKNQNKNKQHEPVLLKEVLAYLQPKSGDSYLDLTAGYGGHALEITDLTGSLTQTVLVDRDKQSIKYLRGIYGSTVSYINKDFFTASKELIRDKRQFNIILADLGVSSPHLNEGSRGFAINKEGPLDMRMDQSQELTASAIVNSYSEDRLIKVLKEYGEEKKALRIARAIIGSRPISTTTELADIVASVKPRRKIHAATQTFQALRVEVNDELNLLEQSLPLWLELLAPEGRIAVISFHSLEDRLVKLAFKDASNEFSDPRIKILTKSPVKVSPHEIDHNPRARSAKLRAAVKIKTKGN